MSVSVAPVRFSEQPTASGAKIAIACLDAEKSLNSLTLEMIDALWAQFRRWANDPAIAMVVLEGAGERAFCAGADLTRLHATCLAHRASDAREDIAGNAYALDFFSREYRLDYFIHHYPKPILCWGQGVVMGGGMGLMAGCSHRVVTDQLRLAMPEINIGLFPDVGGSWFLSRVPRRAGVFLALTAAQLGAGDAIFAGLADFFIPHARKTAVMTALVAAAWSPDGNANRRVLSEVLAAQSEPVPTDGPLRTHLEAIALACAGNSVCEIRDRIIALAPHGEWFERAAATLRAGSPTTAALSLALQQRLRTASLAEVFRAELVAALTCAARPDLAEGIRALLIDKDRTPRWTPATLEAVTPAWIDGFFECPWSAATHPLADLGST